VGRPAALGHGVGSEGFREFLEEIKAGHCIEGVRNASGGRTERRSNLPLGGPPAEPQEKSPAASPCGRYYERKTGRAKTPRERGALTASYSRMP